MRAKDLHELLRAWENYHRIMTAEAHMKHIQFREETRYPGFYYRTDNNFVDDKNWQCFSNSSYDKKTKKWALKKVPYRAGNQVAPAPHSSPSSAEGLGVNATQAPLFS